MAKTRKFSLYIFSFITCTNLFAAYIIHILIYYILGRELIWPERYNEDKTRSVHYVTDSSFLWQRKFGPIRMVLIHKLVLYRQD